MVFVDGIKFSCEPCVKGHRSAHCLHPDRPLFEVKRKGRPKTQCQKCTERRDRTGGHIRCDCPKVAERALLELPQGALGLPEGSLVLDLPGPLVRHISTSSSTSSASSSRAPSVSAEGHPAEVVRKPSVKRKESNAATKPHDLAHGLHYHHVHTFAPYHTPAPHFRSTPMTRAPSASSAGLPLELDFPIQDLPPLPPLPRLETSPSATGRPPSPLHEAVDSGSSVEALLASLEGTRWTRGDDVGYGQAPSNWPQEAVNMDLWRADASVESLGTGEVNLSPNLGPWSATAEESFDLSVDIDKWRQVLQLESADVPLYANLPGLEWNASHLAAPFDISAPLPAEDPASFNYIPHPRVYDEGFFSSSSASSSKATSSAAGSDYSTSLCQGSQLSLPLSFADFDLSLDSGAAATAFDFGLVKEGGELNSATTSSATSAIWSQQAASEDHGLGATI